MRLAAPPLVAALLASTAFAGDVWEAGTAAVFDGRVRDGEPGLAVLVRHDGKTVFAHGYGVRELRSRARIDPVTAFRLASVDEAATAMAVMLLVHDGKLRYEDALTDVFPAFPAYGRAITLRHLLTHTSGLPDYEDLMAEAEKGRAPIWTAEHQIHDDEVLAEGRGEGPLRSGHELGVQQLGLRRAGARRRAGLRKAVRRVSGRGSSRRSRCGTPWLTSRAGARSSGGPTGTRETARASGRKTRAPRRRRSGTAASTRPSRTSRSGTRPCRRTSPRSRRARCGLP